MDEEMDGEGKMTAVVLFEDLIKENKHINYISLAYQTYQKEYVARNLDHMMTWEFFRDIHFKNRMQREGRFLDG